MYGSEETMELGRLLLEGGADPNAKNRFGEVPLTLCLIRKTEELIKLLLEFGVTGNIYSYRQCCGSRQKTDSVRYQAVLWIRIRIGSLFRIRIRIHTCKFSKKLRQKIRFKILINNSET